MEQALLIYIITGTITIVLAFIFATEDDLEDKSLLIVPCVYMILTGPFGLALALMTIVRAYCFK